MPTRLNSYTVLRSLREREAAELACFRHEISQTPTAMAALAVVDSRIVMQYRLQNAIRYLESRMERHDHA